jgi:predicted nucleic acid-binding protein
MICFDANVIIEILLERPKAALCQTAVQEANDDGAISLLSVTFAMYYAEKQRLDLTAVEHILRTFIWLPIHEADADWAFENYDGDDHEDALQIACSLREQCERFVTLDGPLAKKYRRALPITLL